MSDETIIDWDQRILDAAMAEAEELLTEQLVKTLDDYCKRGVHDPEPVIGEGFEDFMHCTWCGKWL